MQLRSPKKISRKPEREDGKRGIGAALKVRSLFLA